MKTQMIYKAMLLVCALLFLQQGAIAQERGITFHVSGGASVPVAGEVFKDLYNVGYNGSAGLDVHISPQVSLGGEVSYGGYGMDRKAFLELAELPDGDEIEVDGGALKMLEVLALGKFHLSPAGSGTSVYLLGGGGFVKGSISNIKVTAPEGEAEGEFDGGTDAAIAAGIGLQSRLSERSSLMLEVRYGKVFTDEGISHLPVRVGFAF
jgi:opacity protein-like surface antigen